MHVPVWWIISHFFFFLLTTPRTTFAFRLHIFLYSYYFSQDQPHVHVQLTSLWRCWTVKKRKNSKMCLYICRIVQIIIKRSANVSISHYCLQNCPLSWFDNLWSVLCAVVTGATSGIGKAYAREVSLHTFGPNCKLNLTMPSCTAVSEIASGLTTAHSGLISGHPHNLCVCMFPSSWHKEAWMLFWSADLMRSFKRWQERLVSRARVMLSATVSCCYRKRVCLLCLQSRWNNSLILWLPQRTSTDEKPAPFERTSQMAAASIQL